MFTNKQTTVVFGLTIDARYSYASAFKFFFASTNAVACALSLLSLLFVFIVGRHNSNPTNYFLLFLHDLMSLVLSGCAARVGCQFVIILANSATERPLLWHFLSLLSLLLLTIISASQSRQIQV